MINNTLGFIIFSYIIKSPIRFNLFAGFPVIIKWFIKSFPDTAFLAPITQMFEILALIRIMQPIVYLYLTDIDTTFLSVQFFIRLLHPNYREFLGNIIIRLVRQYLMVICQQFITK